MRRIAVAAVIIAMSGSAGIVATASGSPPGLGPSTASGRQEPDGKAVYLANCKQCHGVLGEPTKASIRKYEKIASFREATFFRSRSNDSLRAVVRNGAGRDMKPFKDKLTATEIDVVVKYIHTLAKHEQR